MCTPTILLFFFLDMANLTLHATKAKVKPEGHGSVLKSAPKVK